MTGYEVELAARMWAEGRTSAEIGDALCFSPAYIRVFAAHHRDKFPPRRRQRHGVPSIDLWHERIAAGRASVKTAARALGVSVTTMRRWHAEWEGRR